jgi:ABC-2 type transport system permease protein
MSATSALARRAFSDSRARTASFALLFLFVAAAQVVGYCDSYPTAADRLAFARAFGDNSAIRLFYGVPHDLLTVGGYAAWRVGGFMSVFAALWGALAAVRALRTEEESGRQELVLAAPVSRGRVILAAFAAIAVGAVILWIATFIGLAGARLSLGGSAYLALAVVSPAPVFVGVGALASQLAPGRRLALGLSLSVLVVAFALRVIADTAAGVSWLRWATPLGWVEELRPFAGARPAVLLLPLAASVVLLAVAVPIALRRDVGSGLLRVSESADPNLHLLSSPTALALRGEIASLAGWIAGLGAFALITGIISDSFSSGLSRSLRRELGKLGGGSLLTPAGALGFYFQFFVLVLSLFAVAQVAAARHEEAEGRLETLLALPASRRRWLGGRLLLATGGAVALALVAGVLAWAGAASQSAGIALARMLEAAANCLPATLLFLALAGLAFAIAPRATVVAGYGLVTLAFLWDLLGALLGAPAWTLALSPFHHIGLVPAQAFQATGAVAMLAIAAGAALLSVLAFERRDLSGA